MNHKHLVFGLLLLGVVGLAHPGYAEKPEPGNLQSPHSSRFSKEHWDKFEKTLALSHEQKIKLDEINKRYEGQIHTIEEKMKPLHEAIRTELSASTIDYAKVQNYFEQLSQPQIELKMLGLKHFDEIQGILTPEQRKKMRDHRKKMLQQPFFKKMQNH